MRLLSREPWKTSSSLVTTVSGLTVRSFSIARPSLTSEHEITEARLWLRDLNGSTLPSTVGDVSFSRSSGPGGQNVNKYVSDQDPSIIS